MEFRPVAERTDLYKSNRAVSRVVMLRNRLNGKLMSGDQILGTVIREKPVLLPAPMPPVASW